MTQPEFTLLLCLCAVLGVIAGRQPTRSRRNAAGLQPGSRAKNTKPSPAERAQHLAAAQAGVTVPGTGTEDDPYVLTPHAP